MIDPDLLVNVVEFKQRFCPRGWAKYELAQPGTALVPEGHVLATVRFDYRAMGNMISREVPDFEEMLAVLRAPQEDINAQPGKI